MSGEKTFPLSLLSVTGYLQLSAKPGGRLKKRWCWFDERTCSLKCYKDQTSYTNRINDPLGEIKLASAKLTPPTVDSTDSSNCKFEISNDEGTYQLQAKDNKEALDWIRKLQEKRSGYHKMCSSSKCQDETTKPANVAVRMSGLGKLLPGSPESSPVGVRKIMRQILTPSGFLDNPSLLTDVESKEQLSDGVDETDDDLHPIDDLPLTWSHFGDDTVSNDANCGGVVNQSNAALVARKLRLEYYKSEEASTAYYKEVQKLKHKLELKEIKIHALNQEISLLKEQLSAMSIPLQVTQLQEEKASLQVTMKQLKESIKVFATEVDQHKEQAQLNEKKILSEKERNRELERTVNSVKRKYVEVLTETLFKAMLHDRDSSEIIWNPHLLELLKEEGWETEGVLEDDYGDLHDWNSDTNMQHFLCRCLYLHYTQHEQESLANDWGLYFENLSKTSTFILDRSKKEFRNLLRRGLPNAIRKDVWTHLINRHVAKTKEVKDHGGGGVSYYQSLLCITHQSPCQKQIDLDLHRTMPSNKFFRRGGSGIKQLENVLLAYSLHNKNIGYCQGMNMIAALGLLFLDEETTFWYMVAIIEKLVPPGYYGTGLLGAQADQAVLQEVLTSQVPDISEHLAAFGIEIKLVTFNWFLTLFIDAMPTECALRVMDVFLNEGSKVMHRVAIGIVKVYKEYFLSMSDPVSLFQLLKEITRHTFMIEDVFNVAFVKEFPSRSHLSSRHAYHLNLFRLEWQQREKETQMHKEAAAAVPVVRSLPLQSNKKVLLWECGCSVGPNEICLCSGEKDQGIIAVITAQEEARMEIVPDIVIKGRAVCMKYIPSCDMVLIGTLDFYVYAVDCLQWKELWNHRFIDSVLNMEVIENTVFFALAEGSLAVFKDVCQTCPLSEPLLLHIGSSSVPCLALAPNQMLWCGSEKSITILSTATFEPEKSIVLDDDGLGKIYKMKCGQHGVWVSFRSSTIICLFDVKDYRKLLQVDYATLSISETHERITAILPVQGYLWVGTGDGTIHILSVKARESSQGETHTDSQTDTIAYPKKSGRHTSGGLITRREKTDEEEGEGEEETGDIRLKIASRHTARFGRTLLHRKKVKTSEKRDTYELSLETSKHLVESRKEPVRTLQACLGPDNSTIVVSTVHTDTDKAVQMWRCSDQHASNWNIVYMNSSGK